MGASQIKPCSHWSPQSCVFRTPLLYFVRQRTRHTRRPILSKLRLSCPTNYEYAIDGASSSANYEHATGKAPTCNHAANARHWARNQLLVGSCIRYPPPHSARRHPAAFRAPNAAARALAGLQRLQLPASCCRPRLHAGSDCGHRPGQRSPQGRRHRNQLPRSSFLQTSANVP